MEKIETKNLTITEIAASLEQFNILTKLMTAADINELLQTDERFTLFAPNNEAFSELPEEKIEQLSSDEGKDELINILRGHIVSGDYLIIDVIKSDELLTLAGKTIEITTKNSDVLINDAQLVQADIMAKNGVIHIIDNILG